MAARFYRWAGLEFAMSLLRPGAKFEILQVDGSDWEVQSWSDPRPQPSKDEILRVVSLIRALEDSVDTVYTKDQEQGFADSVGLVFDEFAPSGGF